MLRLDLLGLRALHQGVSMRILSSLIFLTKAQIDES